MRKYLPYLLLVGAFGGYVGWCSRVPPKISEAQFMRWKGVFLLRIECGNYNNAYGMVETGNPTVWIDTNAVYNVRPDVAKARWKNFVYDVKAYCQLPQGDPIITLDQAGEDWSYGQ
jgi:hypothetical protein